MAFTNRYLALATHFRERASRALSVETRLQYAALAAAYVRLAGQADQNGKTDIVYETPPPSDEITDQKRNEGA